MTSELNEWHKFVNILHNGALVKLTPVDATLAYTTHLDAL